MYILINFKFKIRVLQSLLSISAQFLFIFFMRLLSNGSHSQVKGLDVIISETLFQFIRL